MTSPCLVLHTDPPLAIVGHGHYGMIETPGTLRAINLLTGDTEWTQVIRFPFLPLHITAGQSRVFVVSRNGGLFILDFDGNLRQQLDLQAPMHSSAVLSPDRLALVSTDSLRVFEAAADEPPVWVGTWPVACTKSGARPIWTTCRFPTMWPPATWTPSTSTRPSPARSRTETTRRSTLARTT